MVEDVYAKQQGLNLGPSLAVVVTVPRLMTVLRVKRQVQVWQLMVKATNLRAEAFSRQVTVTAEGSMIG